MMTRLQWFSKGGRRRRRRKKLELVATRDNDGLLLTYHQPRLP